MVVEGNVEAMAGRVILLWRASVAGTTRRFSSRPCRALIAARVKKEHTAVKWTRRCWGTTPPNVRKWIGIHIDHVRDMQSQNSLAYLRSAQGSCQRRGHGRAESGQDSRQLEERTCPAQSAQSRWAPAATHAVPRA